jgi:predicted anti-sigma-YlaC factor YlaD
VYSAPLGLLNGYTSRAQYGEKRHGILLRFLAIPKYRALYIAVAQLFRDLLIKGVNVTHQLPQLSPSQDRIPLLKKAKKKISLAAKWALTPGASHDHVTNISSAIALLLHHNHSSILQPFPSSVPQLEPDAMTPDAHSILRRYFARWILRPLDFLLLPEPSWHPTGGSKSGTTASLHLR